MKRAIKAYSVNITETEVVEMFMKVMPTFHNKEALSKFLAEIFNNLDSEHIEALVKHISGVPLKLSYQAGMSVLVKDYALHTWSMDKPLSVAAGYATTDTEDRHWFKAKIINVSPYSIKPYGIIYKYVNTSGEHEEKEIYVSEKSLKSLVTL